MENDEIPLFGSERVRSVWDEKAEKWWFSVLDVIAISIDQPDYKKVKNYWKWLKNKLAEEGCNEAVSNTNHLKLEASDEEMRLTDVADTEQILRLIQSIPSKKAESFKLWLAKIGRERIGETISQKRWHMRLQPIVDAGMDEIWAIDELIAKAGNEPINETVKKVIAITKRRDLKRTAGAMKKGGEAIDKIMRYTGHRMCH